MKGRKSASGGSSAGQVTMAERTGIEQIVEKVVSQVLESHVPQLREDLVRQVLEELQPQLGQAHPGASPENSSANLLKAISTIHAGTTQKEILRALLDNSVRYSGRAALFVIKSGSASGWQGRGFTNNDDVKDVALDVSTGLASRALRSRMAFAGSATEMDPHFVSRFGAPADDEVLVLPLLLKDKVAALVYADAGVEAGGKMGTAALEVLVLAASAWLEVASLRKHALKEGAVEAGAVEKSEAAPPGHTVSSFADPFAAHAPKHAPPSPAPVTAEQVTAAAEAEPVAVSAAAAVARATDEFSQMPPEEADVHRKAQRFSRLLVDEIKLYNQAKVTEGRKSKDLYDRLKDDIEKSRATYQKRFGNTVAAGADYFSHELVRSLAEDDSSIMGANFRR
jgi:hypothetical protein